MFYFIYKCKSFKERYLNKRFKETLKRDLKRERIREPFKKSLSSLKPSAEFCTKSKISF